MNDLFSSIIGHGRAVEALRRMFEADRLPHALLLAGPARVGKRALAEGLAAARLGAERLELHPDFRLIERGRDAKTGKLRKLIAIDAVRGLREHLQFSPILARTKVAVIDEADALSEEASNALLKTLEEPAGAALLILTARQAERVPATVRSRAARFDLRDVPEAEIAAGLVARGAAPDLASRLAAASGGRPGFAVEALERPDMLEWFLNEEARWKRLSGAALRERFASLAELAPPKADREETADRIRDAARVWEQALRRDLRSGRSSAPRGLRALHDLLSSLDVNVQPRLLLERFALALDR